MLLLFLIYLLKTRKRTMLAVFIIIIGALLLRNVTNRNLLYAYMPNKSHVMGHIDLCYISIYNSADIFRTGILPLKWYQ